MRPAKRLNVRGMRTEGDTSMSTPFAVCMYIWSFPALLMGESRRVKRHCAKVSRTWVWQKDRALPGE